VTTTPTFDSWPLCLKRNAQASLRLFCFPYAGGRASLFRTWSDQLPTTVQVCPIQLPGRGSHTRQPPFTQISPLVEALAEALLPHLDQPFALFGHSMGAIISFELARQLRRERRPEPVHLFVSGARAPQVSDRDPPIYNLPDSELLEKLRRLNGTPQEVLEHPELVQLVLPILRADFEAIQTYAYAPGPPLGCPISAFGGVDDHEVSCEHLEAWREQTTAGFRLRMLPGDHFFLQAAQPLLLRTLSQQLHQLVEIVT